MARKTKVGRSGSGTSRAWSRADSGDLEMGGGRGDSDSIAAGVGLDRLAKSTLMEAGGGAGFVAAISSSTGVGAGGAGAGAGVGLKVKAGREGGAGAGAGVGAAVGVAFFGGSTTSNSGDDRLLEVEAAGLGLSTRVCRTNLLQRGTLLCCASHTPFCSSPCLHSPVLSPNRSYPRLSSVALAHPSSFSLSSSSSSCRLHWLALREVPRSRYGSDILRTGS